MIDKTSCASIVLSEPKMYLDYHCDVPGTSGCSSESLKTYDNRITTLATSVFGSGLALTDEHDSLDFNLNSPDVVFEQFFSTGNNNWSYSTESNTPAARKIKKGYDNGTFSIPDLYYIYDSHTNYPNRKNISMKMPFNLSNVSDSNFDTENLNLRNKIIRYDYDFMVGSWSIPIISTNDYNPLNAGGLCESFIDISTMQVDTVAQRYCERWIEVYNKWNDITTYPHDSTGESFSGDLAYFKESNSRAAELLDYLYSTDLYDSTFQNNLIFSNLLNYYTFTRYNLITSKGYMINANNEWSESINVYPDMRLVTSSGDVFIDSSCLITLLPMYYNYVDNGVPYVGWYFTLRLSFFGFLGDNTDFSSVKCRMWLKYQLPVSQNVNILDTFSFHYNYSILSNDDFVADNESSAIRDFINSIPLIGPYVLLLYDIFVSLYQFILNIIYSFTLLPVWFIGGMYVIIAALLIRIVFKIIRG